MAEGHYIDMSNWPSWAQYAMGAQTVFEAIEAEDVEDTLMVQLTLPEFALFTFSMLIVERVFPELTPQCRKTFRKLQELTAVQDYFGDEGEGAPDA